MKYLIILLSLVPFVISGCSTATATFTANEPEPQVTIEIVEYEPDLEWEWEIELQDGSKRTAYSLGRLKAVVHVSPAALFVWYEQSPDLKNWVPHRVPIKEETIETDGLTYSRRLVTFECIPSLSEEPVRRQFLRANF